MYNKNFEKFYLLLKYAFHFHLLKIHNNQFESNMIFLVVLEIQLKHKFYIDSIRPSIGRALVPKITKIHKKATHHIMAIKYILSFSYQNQLY